MSVMRDMWRVNGAGWVLWQWAQWARQVPAEVQRLGYPRLAMFADMRGGSIAALSIDDDTAMAVQDAINALGEHKPELKSVLIEFYLLRRSVVFISGQIAFDRRKVSDMLHSAEAWVDAKLHEFFIVRAVGLRHPHFNAQA